MLKINSAGHPEFQIISQSEIHKDLLIYFLQSLKDYKNYKLSRTIIGISHQFKVVFLVMQVVTLANLINLTQFTGYMVFLYARLDLNKRQQLGVEIRNAN